MLLDEPVAHLDPINANLIKNYLWDFIDKEKITTIFVTHSSEDALSYSSRIAVIHKGEIVESAPAMELYLRAKKKVSAQLLGVMGKVKIEVGDKIKNVYIRPENVFLTQEGKVYYVIYSRFLGDKFLIKVKMDKNKLYFYHTKPIDENELVNLSFKENMLVYCK